MRSDEELKAQDVALAVYFSKKGDVVGYDVLEPCKEVARDKGVTPELIHEIISENGSKVDVKSNTILHVHGSPGCIIYLFGIPICLCCS